MELASSRDPAQHQQQSHITIAVTIPQIMLIAGTRVALGGGIGLLLSDRLNKDQRRAAGWALFSIGVVTTIPIVRGVLGKSLVGAR
jgi:hypothetical protein